MRWLALLAACLAILGLVVGFTTTRGGSQTDARRPVLKLERSIPLTVRGLRFHARERVRVSAGARAARATAGSSGTFVVTIPGTTACNTVRVVARGSAGSFAVVKLLPSPDCLPARRD
jgi:hypothetical protein